MAQKHLLNAAVDHFDLEEIYRVCFNLYIDHEDLAGTTKASKARELISLCIREDRLTNLLEEFTELRPHIDWVTLYDMGQEGFEHNTALYLADEKAIFSVTVIYEFSSESYEISSDELAKFTLGNQVLIASILGIPNTDVKVSTVKFGSLVLKIILPQIWLRKFLWNQHHISEVLGARVEISSIKRLLEPEKRQLLLKLNTDRYKYVEYLTRNHVTSMETAFKVSQLLQLENATPQQPAPRFIFEIEKILLQLQLASIEFALEEKWQADASIEEKIELLVSSKGKIKKLIGEAELLTKNLLVLTNKDPEATIAVAQTTSLRTPKSKPAESQSSTSTGEALIIILLLMTSVPLLIGMLMFPTIQDLLRIAFAINLLVLVAYFYKIRKHRKEKKVKRAGKDSPVHPGRDSTNIEIGRKDINVDKDIKIEKDIDVDVKV
jgi:hypothetical protein